MPSPDQWVKSVERGNSIKRKNFPHWEFPSQILDTSTAKTEKWLLNKSSSGWIGDST